MGRNKKEYAKIHSVTTKVDSCTFEKWMKKPKKTRANILNAAILNSLIIDSENEDCIFLKIC